ncbi:hypothetical protein F3J23_14275 [Chryseobacterium sp. Tr-659]|uniref:contractile injection system tape measure protein n=1 Tax=Chryseobacterium sp. Tr-659 TaxID=2608340 RepID=UPI00141F2D7F|nr:contractile injection system tape measure protein [Chryseobacterium sp. Tr-659]NIF06612.1 hypothetical protein [Chryseobacterium sp. Tr-659]
MKQDHIIQKVFVEITVNNKEKALGIKEDINSFLSIDVFPEIEKYINTLEYNLAGHTLQIPRLELNLDVKNSLLNSELKDQIVQHLEKELSEITESIVSSDQKTENDSQLYLVNNQEKVIQAFIYFLEKGSMPWWNLNGKSIAVLEPAVFEAMILTKNFGKRMIPVLSKQHVQERIINQLSNKQIAQLCQIILEDRELKIDLGIDTIQYISALNHTERVIIWQLVFNILSKDFNSSNHNIQEYILQQISKIETASSSQAKSIHQHWKTAAKIFPFIIENEILNIIKNNITDNLDTPETLMKKMDSIEQKNTESHEDLSENGQYVQNAGLVLIHPFIKTFFEHCDLLHPETGQLLDPELCVHLLHYIATGNTNAPEYDMIFEKFLCNIPINQSINKHIKISRKHKTQAKNVIESVQHNWGPMKKSSAALLQNEFFQRSGKLVITDYDYTLTVERKTQDILMEKLAWGVGLIKLPWKEKFIFVNW